MASAEELERKIRDLAKEISATYEANRAKAAANNDKAKKK